MKRQGYRRGAWVALVLTIGFVIASCSTEPPQTPEPLPPPTLEPASIATPASPPAQPTVTPVPLGQADTARPPLGGPTTECVAGTLGATRLPGQRFGVNIPPSAAPIERSFDLARDMHAEWVRATLRWSDLEPQQGAYRWESLDALADGALSRGLHVLLVITDAPTWAVAGASGGLPDRPQDFGAFMGALASQARGRITAYEIWRNPNTAAANGGTTAQPGQYVEVLKAAYSAVKSADPCAIVLNGALLPTASRDPKVAIDDLAFYRGMLAYNNGEVRKAYDILAVQLNTSGVAGKGKWPRAYPTQSRGFYGHVDMIHDEMTAGDEADKQVWVVQVGYRVDGETAVTPEQQGQYLVDLFPLSRKAYPWISTIFVRDLGIGTPADDVPGFSLLNPDGTPRVAYGMLRNYFGAERAKRERIVSIKGTDLVELWSFGPNSRPIGRLVAGPDGAIYTLTSIGFVRAVDPNGAFRLAVHPAKRNVLGVAIDSQQRIYTSADDGTLWAFSDGGEVLWSVLTDGVPATSLLLNRDEQTLYTGTSKEHLDAYSIADGHKLWGAQLDGILGEPALGADGTVYVGTTEGTLYAVAPDGTPRWKYQAEAWVHSAPIISGTLIYAASEEGAIFALDSTGAQRWRFELGAAPAGLALGSDGMVYASTADGQLHALDRDGRPRWTTPLGGGAPTAPAAGTDGLVYVGAEDGGLRVVRPDGAIAGVFGFDVPIRIPPLVGSDGAVYVALGDGQDYLTAFGPRALKKQYQIP